jgi:hypothetical protein
VAAIKIVNDVLQERSKKWKVFLPAQLAGAQLPINTVVQNGPAKICKKFSTSKNFDQNSSLRIVGFF